MLKNQMLLVITEYMKRLNGDQIIISVSGGVDSMALLHAMTHDQIHVVHFNHQVRDDSDVDVDIVKTFCDDHELTYDIFYLDVPKANFQHEAHMIRQEKLLSVARHRNIKHVFTAHHADDQNETILMRLMRGSDFSGYSGLQISENIEGITFHKPLLTLSKEIIKAYALTNQVPFHQDSSNDEDTYLRNRLRHHVLPKLHAENPNLNEAFSRYHEQLHDAFDYIQSETRNISIDSLTRTSFNQLHRALKTQLLITLFRSHHLSYSYDHVTSAIDLLESNVSNGELHVSSGKKFIVSYDTFKVISIQNKLFDVIELTEGSHQLGDKHFSIFFDNDLLIKDCAIKLCYNKDALPLIARHRLDGDVLEFSFGHKKLKDFFIDKKIPKYLRDQLLLIVDQNNTILWVENVYLNQTIQTSNIVGIKGDFHASRY